jgi:uncharacterized cupin superfamily protein
VFSDPGAPGERDPEGYRSLAAAVGDRAGGRQLAVKVYHLPAGQSVCPYHYEYEEEWLLVLTGLVHLRTAEGEEELQPGELVCFEPGPGGAHKVTNRTTASARVMMFSNARSPAVAVYPDSEKIGLWPGNPADEVMLRRRDGQLDYWDGER